MFHGFYSIIAITQLHWLPFLSGEPGFRNVRDGGETVQTNKDGPYMVYLVFRSFRKPPG